ncbi:unnamed protein product, partial [Discosporangium mesarthrocarpum]
DPGAGINKLALCSAHQLLAAGTDGGYLHLWDARAGSGGGSGGKGVAAIDLRDSNKKNKKVTAVTFAEDGLSMAIGTSSAHCLTFDLRSSRPTFVKEHQYGLPVSNVKFHKGPERRVLSCDTKTVKIWGRDDGQVVTNVETPADINDLCIAQDA